MYRFHLLGYVHLPASLHYLGCAFTCKAIRLAKMLTDAGHEVFYYGCKSDNPVGVEQYCNSNKLHFIETHKLKDIRRDWGEGDNRFEVGYNWKLKGFKHDINGEKSRSWYEFNRRAIYEINRVKKPDDFLLVMQGYYQKPIVDKVKLDLTCEPGIGYRGSFVEFRAFESAYIQNFTYGSETPFKSVNGHYYDRVVPNYFDERDFIFGDKPSDYYLYIGRLIKRKGVWTAIKATQEIGAKLKLAGQTDPEINIHDLPEHCEYVGYVGVEERKTLLAEAKAVFVPTTYLEPFAGTHIEAMLSGTPVITTDFGVFPGTFLQGKHGFRCNTLDDFVWATKKVRELDRREIRKFAERYLMQNVSRQFLRWFSDLHDWWESTQGDKAGWHRVYETDRERL